VSAGDKLPKGTQISYLVDRLQKLSATALSPSEKKLARWVQIKLPPDADIDAALREITSWPSVAEAQVVPPPSLPGPMGPPLA
jgi:hypothetical protein